MQSRENIAYSSLAATAATSIHPVTQCEPQLGGGCEASTTRSNNGQERQVHEREEGGRLVDDGDIHINGDIDSQCEQHLG
jgi:hypothetical protein